jgi:hypothetical protein
VACIVCSEMILDGAGSISLGQAFSEQTIDPVEFSVFSAPAQHK